MTFGEMIGRLRELRGATQKQVEEAAGGDVSAVAVCRIEHGDRPNQTVATVHALARALDFELTIGPAGVLMRWPVGVAAGVPVSASVDLEPPHQKVSGARRARGRS